MRKSAVALIAAIATVSIGVIAAPATAAPVRAGDAAHAAARRPIVTPVHSGAAVRMGHYSLSQFESGARKLPSGLTSQLQKQLGISGAQFLADGQAASDASKVIGSLRERGVDVSGSSMNGTSLTVYVPNATDAAAARAVGATAVVGTQPAVPAPLPKFKTDSYTQKTTSPGAGTSPLLGGDGWWYFDGGDSSGERYLALCSVGFLGYNATSGSREFATAGHCADPSTTGGDPPSDDINGVNGSVYSLFDGSANPEDNAPSFQSDLDASQADTLGVLSTSAFKFGGGDDYGTVPVTGSKAKPQNEVTTWGGTTSSSSSSGVQNAGTPVSIIGDEAPISNAVVCHSGHRTGWQCGKIQSVESHEELGTDAGTEQQVDGFTSTAYVCEGDSGGSLVTGQYAVGTLTGGNWPEPADGSCVSESQSKAMVVAADQSELVSIAFPLVSPAAGDASFAADDPSFELGVMEPATTPTLMLDSNTNGSGTPTTLYGTLASVGGTPAPSGTPVSLTVDALTTASTTSAANSSGTQAWQFALSDLLPGTNTYTLTVGTGHSAVTRTGSFDVPVTVSRPTITGTTTVGDTLTAGHVTPSPNAAVTSYQWYNLGTDGAQNTPIGGATSQTYRPGASLARHELAVTATVTEHGATLVSTESAPTVPLTGGPVIGSASISGSARVGGTLTANATGEIAGTSLTYQWKADGKAIAGATAKTLHLTDTEYRDTVTVTISGSLNGYTSAVKTSAATAVVAPSVARVAGADRWATAVAASKAQFPTGVSTVFIASGENYPDALSAAPAAAKVGGDLLLTAPTSLPASVSSELRRLSPKTVYLIGGTSAISGTVAKQIGAVSGVTPKRIAGADRYATSAAIVAKFFPSAAAVFAATGTGFPDALSGAGAAAGMKDPVLLVPGTSSAPTAAGAAQLRRLKPSVIYLVGGTAVVSTGMQKDLARIATVKRLAGADRYATSVAVAKGFHSSSAQAVIASGANFPDALVGSVLAGSKSAPLVLSSPGCMPSDVATELRSLRAGELTLMGGVSGLSAAVADEKTC